MDVVVIFYFIYECDVQILIEGDFYCSVVNKMIGQLKILKLKGLEVVIVDYVVVINIGSKDFFQKVSELFILNVIYVNRIVLVVLNRFES